MVCGVEPADQRPAVAREAHGARPAVFDGRATRNQLAQAFLDRGLDRRGDLGVVTALGVELGVAPAADHQPPVRHLAPVLIAIVRVHRPRVEALLDGRGRDHLAASRHDEWLERRDQLRSIGVGGQHHRAAAHHVAVGLGLPDAVVPASADDARVLVQLRAQLLGLGGETVLEADGVDHAVLGHFERGMEGRARMRRQHILQRDLAHREAIVTQLGQRAAHVLALFLGACQPQAARLAVVALDAQRLRQVRDALMRAPSDLRDRARPVTAPERDALGVRLGGQREQESSVAPTRCACKPSRLEHRHVRALGRERVGERQAGDAATDDDDIDVEVLFQRGVGGLVVRPPVRRWLHGGVGHASILKGGARGGKRPAGLLPYHACAPRRVLCSR